MSRDGAVVSLLVVSDGAAIEEPDGYHEDMVAIRKQELTAAAAILGISQLHELGLPDGQLIHHPKKSEKPFMRSSPHFGLTLSLLRLPSTDIAIMLLLVALRSSFSVKLRDGRWLSMRGLPLSVSIGW